VIEPHPRERGFDSVIPVTAAALIDAAACGYCAVFKDRGEAGHARAHRGGPKLRARAGRGGAGLSKLNSMRADGPIGMIESARQGRSTC
jgi:hypothetical protein